MDSVCGISAHAVTEGLDKAYVEPGAGVSSPNGDGEALSVAVRPDDAGCGMTGLHELFGPTFLKERCEY
jgi:hypothetical protein